MPDINPPAANNPARADRQNERVPGEQPAPQDAPPIDDAPVPPLTVPEDTEGG